jgi:hypothetical protein
MELNEGSAVVVLGLVLRLGFEDRLITSRARLASSDACPQLDGSVEG